MVIVVIRWLILRPIIFYHVWPTRPCCGIGKKGLRAMHSKDMVEGIPDFSFEFDFCEHRIYGKKIHVSFPNKDARAKRILELVRSDMFRPVSVPSLGVSKYYVSFIDNFSRMTQIYFLKKKSEVF